MAFKTKKQKIKFIFISVITFYMLLNGYRCFNNMFSGDSLLMVTNDDSAWQIALGRFVQPILILLRGGVVNPWLISILSILWISLAAVFLLDYLMIDNRICIVAITGVMVCNISVICSNATYLPWMDFYALALFLAVLGVWLVNKNRLSRIIPGILCFSISLGIYQAYIAVSITLVMISVFQTLLRKEEIKKIVLRTIKNIVTVVIGLVIYYIVWKIFQKIFNIWTADSYNGLASVGDYSECSLLDSVIMAYEKVIAFFVYPDTFITMTFRGKSLSIVWLWILRLCNSLIVLLTIFKICKINRKHKLSVVYWIFEALVLILLPLGMNFICIISKGMTHPLMLYSFCMLYVFAITVISFEENRTYLGVLLLFVTAVTIYSNIVYANQVYLKKNLQDDAAESMMTRIVYEIEHLEGYKPGITPVTFVGSFEMTDYTKDIEGFEEILPYSMGKTSLLYGGTEYAYLKYNLDVNMNFIQLHESNDEIDNMPYYPDDGSIGYVDGIVVVKICDFN